MKKYFQKKFKTVEIIKRSKVCDSVGPYWAFLVRNPSP